MFPELVEFVSQNGHARPDPDDHPELYQWTKQLRSNYRHQYLNPDNPETNRPIADAQHGPNRRHRPHPPPWPSSAP